MKISIVTLFPDLYRPFLATSIVDRAQARSLIDVSVENLFEYCEPKTRVDAPQFGHGSGMLIKPELIQKAVDQVDAAGKSYKIFFSPRGKKLDQDLLKEVHAGIERAGGHVVLFPARYEGMDARVEEFYADQIISVGDYVLMGGDLPAMVFLEGLLRLIPGVVGKTESVEEDSFSGSFVDFPAYTTPVVWQGMAVPDVLRSGNHQAVDAWRHDQAVRTTVYGHFDWLRSHPVDKAERSLVHASMPSHYAVLMHDQVLLPDGTEGRTSVTSLDIHDIARSALTYGFVGYYLVSSLEDQQKIVTTLLDFWTEGSGVTYNPHRHRAVKATHLARSLDEVIAAIAQKEGKEPIVVATSARGTEAPEKLITYHEQHRVWGHERPVLFVFGTGHGLGQTVINRVDYILVPLEGYSDFNHLSVRSAAAVVFDRWLGMQPKKVFKKSI